MDQELLINVERNEYASIDLIRKLEIKTGINFKDIAKIIQYNVVTPLQLSVLTGKNVNTINNLLRPSIVKGQITFRLKKAYPFQAGSDLGPMFVQFDQNCLQYIEDALQQ